MKIGLLAMSGVRAHDKDLMAFGLTLPGFVERSKGVASLPSLGLLYLAAVTPATVSLKRTSMPISIMLRVRSADTSASRNVSSRSRPSRVEPSRARRTMCAR